MTRRGPPPAPNSGVGRGDRGSHPRPRTDSRPRPVERRSNRQAPPNLLNLVDAHPDSIPPHRLLKPLPTHPPPHLPITLPAPPRGGRIVKTNCKGMSGPTACPQE